MERERPVLSRNARGLISRAFKAGISLDQAEQALATARLEGKPTVTRGDLKDLQKEVIDVIGTNRRPNRQKTN